MRFAILSDVHGNLPAFEAALHHLAQQAPDQVILAGDIVVGSPDSSNCWKLAQSLGCPMLRGNHERYVAHYGTPRGSPLWQTEQFAPLHWALAQFNEEDRALMGRLPEALRFPEFPDLLLVHASARNDYDTVAVHTPEEDLQAMFPGVRERYIIRAHNHVGQVRLWNEQIIITNSSVGLPLDGNPTAQYLLLDKSPEGWRIRHQSVSYDLDTVLDRFQSTGYLEAAGPIGRLFLREVVTASQHLVPFFRLYGRWSKESSISLGEAVNRFLNEF